MKEPAERRDEQRTPSDKEVVLHTGGDELSVPLVNISSGGALLGVDIGVAPNSAVTLTVPDFDLTVSGNIRRVADGATAVEFDDETVGKIVAGWARAPI